MKSWIKRFGMLAVLGAIAGSALVAGCSPAAEEEPVGNTATETPADPAAEPAGEGS